MYSISDLENMKNINYLGKENLIDISDIKIDTSLSEEKRLESYINQIKNPYQFKSGNVSVSIGFKDNDNLKNILSKYFIHSKI